MNYLKVLVKKALYWLGFELSIDWKKRARLLGEDSVYDSRTVQKKATEKTTEEQSRLYSTIIDREFINSEVRAVLDFGCGVGRHFKLLSSLECLADDVKIVGYENFPGSSK